MTSEGEITPAKKTRSEPSEPSKLATEFLGTFLLTFVVGLNLTQCETDTGFGPIAIGCALMVLVYATASISGGHLNPAVTFSVMLQQKIEQGLALKYVIAQCAGGCLAGLASGFMVGFEAGKAELGPTSATFWLGAPLCEFFYTFLLCFVYLNVLVEYDKLTKVEEIPSPRSDPPSGYGVAIGFVVIAAKGAGAVSGAALNPAVTLGINFMGPNWKTLYLPVYAAVQLAGGFAATTAVHIVRPATKREEDLRSWITKQAFWIESLFDPEDTSEFLGTFFIALTISLNAMIFPNPGAIWSVGSCFMVMIYALGPVSGGVFNPALTLGLACRWYGTGLGFGPDKLSDPVEHHWEWKKYCLAQLVGAAAGSGATILIYLFSGSWPTPSVGPACLNMNATMTQEMMGKCDKHTTGQAFFAECFGTFLLSYVVLTVASTNGKAPLKDYAAFCVGSCIIAGGYSFGAISGGLLNPAVTLCNSIGFQFQVLTSSNPLLYMGAQALGGILSAGAFKFLTHPHEFEHKEDLKESLMA